MVTVKLIQSFQVLLMTLQNAPPGLDYERDKKFSKVYIYKRGFDFQPGHDNLMSISIFFSLVI